MLLYFSDLVTELGGNPEELVEQAGLDLPAYAAGAPVASYKQVFALMELAANDLACPDFGMRLAMRQGGTAILGPLGTVMRHSRTLGSAVTYACEHSYAHSSAAHLWLSRRPFENGVFVGHDALLDDSIGKGQAVEHILLTGCLVAAKLTGNRARARRIHLRRRPLLDSRVYRRYFGCDVLFTQKEDGAFYSDRDFASEIVDPDSAQYESAVSYIERHFEAARPPVDVQVRGIITHLLGSEECTHEKVAAALGLNSWTLHRRLLDAGTTFRDLKNRTTRDLMLYFIRETDLEFTDIAGKLGFSEQSALARRCRQWFAASPTRLRTAAGVGLPM